MKSNESPDETQQKENIHHLTGLMELELERLKSTHSRELDNLKNSYLKGIQHLSNDLEDERLAFYQAHLQHMHDMEEQINYLTELYQSQRIMMEDQLLYIKSLEKKIIL